ncbi:glucosyl-3-phosphoglycerate synthase [Desulfuromusa kysingii]|uniref:Glucosyl-3-phosphoglycerate synthase n=1 Tax=Desulfuromusa kysingii TaxID=37625 RepID=A0A1H4AVR6_9BACT|nr:glycosyl transferase [Desulfuromusa kysingii]SEA39961.1 glucosyl-3-phosphoglycerate synthase [Desulfuromusa kysingii]
MADFFQNGVITTLHNLTNRSTEDLESDLLKFSSRRPMSLVLPSLYSELEGPALGPILDDLKSAKYLREIVIGLDRADASQFNYAKDYFGRLPQEHRILWNDGPRLREVDKMLADKGLAPTEMGKGRNVWYCFGYVLASGRSRAVALHDCDIVTYKRNMLARLIYPVANPAFNYQFCKGFYSRIANESLNGRVCRLLVTPLLRSLQKVVGHTDYLEYLDSFRYALAGEFSMQVDVLNDLRIPSDWGLEIGILSEMYRNYTTTRVCQVDIADTYDHKHQEMSADNPQGGLSRMSTDITKAVIRKLATQGMVFTPETFRTIKATYFREALDFVERFYNDAQMNGLSIDRHKEEKAVELFAENIMRAGEFYLQNPMETPNMPTWNRVISAIPDILDHIYEAVEADNK